MRFLYFCEIPIPFIFHEFHLLFHICLPIGEVSSRMILEIRACQSFFFFKNAFFVFLWDSNLPHFPTNSIYYLIFSFQNEVSRMMLEYLLVKVFYLKKAVFVFLWDFNLLYFLTNSIYYLTHCSNNEWNFIDSISNRGFSQCIPGNAPSGKFFDF